MMYFSSHFSSGTSLIFLITRASMSELFAEAIITQLAILRQYSETENSCSFGWSSRYLQCPCQVRAHNRNHFPPMLQKTGVVGQIAEGAWYVYTLDWPCDPNRFPMRHGCLVGIQVIPITAVSKHWVDQVSHHTFHIYWSSMVRQRMELWLTDIQHSFTARARTHALST